jgi:hypothetical protein
VDPVVKVSARELAADPAKYRGKQIQVRGMVLTATPPMPTARSYGVLTLDGGADAKGVTCRCLPGEFDKAKASHGAEVELDGTVSIEMGTVSMNRCSVVAPSVNQPKPAVDFTRELAQKGTNIEANYKNKSVTLTGNVEAKAEADGTGRLVLTGYSDSKNPMPQKVVAQFGPEWKDLVGKVKVGDEVIVSGGFVSYQSGVVTLRDCWLIPK